MLVRWATDHAGQPGGADPVTGLVGDDDLVRRHRSAEPQRRRDAGDDTVTHTLVVGGVDVDTERDTAVEPGRVHGGTGGAQTLRENAGGTAVQQAVWLRVALDRHSGDHTLRRRFKKRDSHTSAEGTGRSRKI